MAIEAAHYHETRTRLTDDPIVLDMAAGLLDVDRTKLTHDDGGPRHWFMGQANDEYRSRGGRDGGHMGAIAEALLLVLDEKPIQIWFELPDTPGIEGVLGVANYRRCQIRPGVRMGSNLADWRIVAAPVRRGDEWMAVVERV